MTVNSSTCVCECVCSRICKKEDQKPCDPAKGEQVKEAGQMLEDRPTGEEAEVKARKKTQVEKPSSKVTSSQRREESE